MKFVSTRSGLVSRYMIIVCLSIALFSCANRVPSTDVGAARVQRPEVLGAQPWMKKRTPSELPVMVMQDSGTDPQGQPTNPAACSRLSDDLAPAAVQRTVEAVLIEMGITPIPVEQHAWHAAPENVSLAVVLKCPDTEITYGILFVSYLSDDEGFIARSAAGGNLGASMDNNPNEVLNALRGRLQAVVAKYREANEI